MWRKKWSLYRDATSTSQSTIGDNVNYEGRKLLRTVLARKCWGHNLFTCPSTPDIVWQKSMQEVFSKCVPNISSCLQNDLDWPLKYSKWLKIDVATSVSRNMASGQLSAHVICECENLYPPVCCIFFDGFGNILRGIYWKVSCSVILGFWTVWYVFLTMSEIYWLSEALKPFVWVRANT